MAASSKARRYRHERSSKPFGNLDDFAPAPAKQKANRAVIDQVAEEHGFPSRQPAKQTNAEIAQPAPAPAPPRQQRRQRTGRNAQINIKATPEAIDDLYRLADKEGKTLSEIFELALAAFERELKS